MDFSKIIAAELRRHPDLVNEMNGDEHQGRLLASQIAAEVAAWQRPGWEAKDYAALRSAAFDAVFALRS